MDVSCALERCGNCGADYTWLRFVVNRDSSRLKCIRCGAVGTWVLPKGRRLRPIVPKMEVEWEDPPKFTKSDGTTAS